MKSLKGLTTEQKNCVIKLAWADRISFETIADRTGLCEKEVIRLMRRELRPGSFRSWRARVSGQVTKHRKRARIVHETVFAERLHRPS